MIGERICTFQAPCGTVAAGGRASINNGCLLSSSRRTVLVFDRTNLDELCTCHRTIRIPLLYHHVKQHVPTLSPATVLSTSNYSSTLSSRSRELLSLVKVAATG
jgi:hypothetical protein